MAGAGHSDGGRLAFLRDRREAILERVGAACARVGRDPVEVGLLAVSKTVDVGDVVLAREAGWERFGENRPQELGRKLEGLWALGVEPPPFEMIGNLQTNKVNALLGRVARIQSVASAHLAQAISSRAERRGLVVPVLLEVNALGEATKSGFAPDELIAFARGLERYPGMRAEGVMGMAPAHDPRAARRAFRTLRELRDRVEAKMGLALPVLSMGMSDDYEIAVEEGATLLRLGRVAFDERHPLDAPGVR